MKFKTFLAAGVFLALLASPVKAGDDVIKVKGDACEKFAENQSKSTVRVRVTDKASYKAVSRIQVLSSMRSKMLEHDFNVIVYNLVDNYVQDLMVKTTSQNDSELCVEVTAELTTSDIDRVINEYSAEIPAPEYDIKDAAGIREISLDEIIELPEEEDIPEPDAEIFYQATDEEIAEIDEAKSYEEIPVAVEEEKGLVYVAPVEFYNNTNSSKSADTIREFFNNADILKLVDDKNSAYYILSARVLKAKVDILNSKTKRLQMVVSVELKTTASELSVTEHQNRFVLFEEGETEQEVAQSLLKKLLQKATEKLYQRIDQMERKRNNIALPSIITPALNSSF